MQIPAVSRRLNKVRHRFRRMLRLDHVAYDGQRLPPHNMRYCGSDFRNDKVFLDSGKAEAQRLARDFGMGRDTAVLEIGCGPGRLPIGIIALGLPVGCYDGVDIDRAAIDWCRRYITSEHPNFRFHAVDARHERYNPKGRPMQDGFRLDAEDSSFDLVYLHSVFANMVPEDVEVYCREFARVLRPGGRVFLTAFIEENVPDVTYNPTDYLIASSGKLNVARYEQAFFFDIVRRAGLEVVMFDHRGDLGGQSVLHLGRRADIRE